MALIDDVENHAFHKKQTDILKAYLIDLKDYIQTEEAKLEDEEPLHSI